MTDLDATLDVDLVADFSGVFCLGLTLSMACLPFVAIEPALLPHDAAAAGGEGLASKVESLPLRGTVVGVSLFGDLAWNKVRA